MKLKSKLSLAFIVVCSVFIMLCGAGCDDSSGSSFSGSRSCQKCKDYNQKCKDYDQKCRDYDLLKQEKEELTQNLNSAIAERDKAKDEARKEARKNYIILSIIAYVVLGIGIVLIGSFILMMRSARKNMPKSAMDNLHCPRCGWEHAAGETICKNCKTHF